MADRALRGSRLGASSFEDERGVAEAPRQIVHYVCERAHRIELTFAAEAEVPDTWECPRCGSRAVRLDAGGPVERDGKPVRTHWDMLMERRTMAELEELLAERLELLRTGQIGPESLHRHPRRRASSPRRTSA